MLFYVITLGRVLMRFWVLTDNNIQDTFIEG